MTHKFVTRIPDEIWDQLEQTAAASNCSVNSLVVGTLGAAMTSGSIVSWTQTVNYAGASGALPSFYTFTLNASEEEKP